MSVHGRRSVYVLGVGMTRFGKHVDRTMKSLAGEAVAKINLRLSPSTVAVQIPALEDETKPPKR